ncbi:podoplanin isoform X2 [Elgaria multicarinata webbii]|uniref:podoplanin isoform X2 n=1 Tax=Elgaria multicarinata webbii TaxID=159646 RepID=UPI002FCCBBAF
MFLKMELIVFLIGSVSFCVFAEEASTPLFEEEAVTADIKDGTEGPTVALMTSDGILSTSDGGENSTEPNATETSDDGLETAALVGIIIGIIIAIGVATAIILTVVKKMSGRP